MDALILSNALDTNGQNARFVRAAERFGDDPDVLHVLALGNTDPAGVMARFQLASEHEGRLSIRSAHRADQYFHFPADIRWHDSASERLVRRLAAEADVIHLNNSWMPYTRLRLRKPALLHHHGSMFRKDSAAMMTRAASMRMTQAVSTLDLTRPNVDRLHWLPTAYNLDELAELRNPQTGGTIRVVSCPTNRGYKSTDALIVAVDRLRAASVPVELVLVEGMTWTDAMAVKATADVVFDQVLLGYGCNAVEAWGMGIPVIAGADDWTLERMRSEFDGVLPFYVATEDTIGDAIRAMVESASLRAEYAAIGQAHVQRWHAERPALARLASLYARAIADFNDPRAHTLGAPVSFHNPQHRKLAHPVTGEVVSWDAQGRVTTQDALLVVHLRQYAKAHRLFGLVEVDA